MKIIDLRRKRKKQTILIIGIMALIIISFIFFFEYLIVRGREIVSGGVVIDMRGSQLSIDLDKRLPAGVIIVENPEETTLYQLEANSKAEELITVLMKNISNEALVRETLSTLTKGQYVFNPPKEMKVGEKERIEVRITEDIAADLTKDLKGRGTPQVDKSIEVGTFMKVRLCCGPPGHGHPFDIISLNEAEQVVTNNKITEWAFDVTPRESGKQKLQLIITVRIKLPGMEDEKKDHPVIEKTIHVKVNAWRSTNKFIKNNWQWLAVTIIIPLILFVWRYYRNKSKSKLT